MRFHEELTTPRLDGGRYVRSLVVFIEVRLLAKTGAKERISLGELIL
ncbi:hypothetical protein ACFQD2_08540 [Pseudomonas lini]